MTGRERTVYQRTCPRCLDSFTTTHHARKYCSDCRMTTGAGSLVTLPTAPEKAPQKAAGSVPGVEVPEPGPLERAISAQLEEMGLAGTWRAESAIGLARDLDRPGTSGAPRTSMTKQLNAMMTEFEALAPREPDSVDSWQDAARKIRGN